jgi:hypothetical protein
MAEENDEISHTGDLVLSNTSDIQESDVNTCYVTFIHSVNMDFNTDLLRLKICPVASRRRMEVTASFVQRHSATTFTSRIRFHSSGLPSACERQRITYENTAYQSLAIR